MNKIIVSIVFAIILIVGINKITDAIFYTEKPEKSAYQVESVAKVEKTVASETDDSENIMALFASTSASDGAKVFKKCAACHSINKGGSNKIGPALWSVVDRNMGGLASYKYSSGMKAMKKKWGYEELNAFMVKPRKYVKGTKMAYVGLKRASDRANLILFLRSLSSSPKALP